MKSTPPPAKAAANRYGQGRNPMDINPTKTYRILQAVAGLVFLLVLFFVSRYNYLLFHGLVELFAIAVAWSVFLLVWNTRRISSNDALLFVGIAYFFVGFIDLVHTLAYKGMGVFADSLAPNHPTQLWIAARGIEAAALLLFPLLLGRRIRPWPVLLGCAGVTGLLLAAILAWDIFSACYIEGAGLTGFKVGAEYVICAMLALAIGLLFKQRGFLDGAVWWLMVAAMAVTIAGELAFTLYTDVYGLSNVLGRLLKVVSFFLVYQALVPATVARPLTTVFRGVEQEKQILGEEGRHLRLLHKTTSLFLESETLGDTIGTLPGLIADHYAVPIVAIELYDADRQEMVFAGAAGIPNAEGGRLRVPVDQTISGTVATSGRAVIDLDVSEQSDYRAEALRELGVTTFACVPLTGQKGVIGTLAIADREERADILDGADLLQALANTLTQEIERHRQEEHLRESEERYRLLAESATDVIWTRDLDMKLTYISPSVEMQSGFSVEEKMRQPLDESMTPESAAISVRIFGEELALESEGKCEPDRSRIIELEMRRKDGTTYPIEMKVSFLRDEKGAAVGIIGVNRDITERKQAEETYRNLFLNSQIGLFRTDIDTGLIIDANDAVARFIGYNNREELLSAPFSIIERYVDPRDREKLISLLKKHGRFTNFETDFRKNDGSIIHMRFSGKLVPGKGWMEGVSEDITERRQAEEALQQKMHDLGERTKELNCLHGQTS